MGTNQRRHHRFAGLSGVADMDPPYEILVGSRRRSTSRSGKRDVALEPSPELLGSIFNSITKQSRSGRIYARLIVDDSGRWRVARTADVDEIPPGDERDAS
jgi:hypothetical protein